MKRDIIISGVIGLLAGFLPIWKWTGTGVQVCGMLLLWLVAFILLFGTEKDPAGGNPTGQKKNNTTLL